MKKQSKNNIFPNFGEHNNSCFANLTEQSVYCTKKRERKKWKFTKESVNITEKCKFSRKSVKLTEKMSNIDIKKSARRHYRFSVSFGYSFSFFLG